MEEKKKPPFNDKEARIYNVLTNNCLQCLPLQALSSSFFNPLDKSLGFFFLHLTFYFKTGLGR